LACTTVPCAAANAAVPAGGDIAGAPTGSSWAEVAWAGGAWGTWALEARGMGRVAVNDRNTDFAQGYAMLAVRWNKTYHLGGGLRMEWLARVDNLADHKHAGSIIVNDANGRFFEPGAPRSLLLALRLVTVL
jgi:iron complex outermembrane receptor protein